MLLADYIHILNYFGGNLISTERTSFPKIMIPTVDQFFLISTIHLRSRERVTTCFLNLLMTMMDKFDANKITDLLVKKTQRFDPKLVGVLSDLIINELSNDTDKKKNLDVWDCLKKEAFKQINASEIHSPEPLLKSLPPPRKKFNKIFLNWGYLYHDPLIDPKKYLKPRYFLPT